MPFPLYMDQHVKAAVTDGLRRRGIDVITTMEDETYRWEDEAILVRAKELGRIVFTQDDDFLAIADQWLKDERSFPGLVYGHQLSVTIGQAIHDLELLSKVLDTHDMVNHIEFIPLR